MSIPLLADPGLALMRQMGIVFRNPGKDPLPAPSIYVTGKGGRVLFQHVDPDYRVRLRSEVILAAARTLQ